MDYGRRMNPRLSLGCAMLLGITVTVPAQDNQNASTTTNSPDRAISARFSADGKQIATTSGDKNMRVWDASTGKLVADLASHFGAWQLASFKYGDAEKWSEVPAGERRVKLITDKHFTWVAYEVPSGKIQTMAGGSCTYSNGAYLEVIEYAGEGVTDYIGKKQMFTLKVDGDKLHQSGQLSDGTKIEEIWQRIK